MTFEDKHVEVFEYVSLPCGEHCYKHYWREKEGEK